jgi:branched-chain amino acid transport system ATP-binding protein
VTEQDAGLLEVRDVSLHFGGVTAIDSVSFSVAAGEVCGLIGPNGAGKTSLFNCISRFYRPQAGSIRFDGTDVLAVPGHRLARLGIARTFQELALFPTMSVRENVELATFAVTRSGWWAGALGTRSARREQRRTAGRADALLALLDLTDIADAPVPELPFGTRKRVEIARALAAEPRLLLLDEPASGLTPGELAPFTELLRRLRRELELTVLLIEHQMAMVMTLCDRVVVLDGGRVLTEGTPREVAASPTVQDAYLGAPA